MARSRVHLLAPLLTAFATAACTYLPAPTAPRPALPPPSAARGTDPASAPILERLEREDDGPMTGTLRSGAEAVDFTWLRHPDNVARPCVLLVPILAGGADLMTTVANRMFALDFDVAFCARAGSALVPPQRGPELQELLRRTVLHQRVLLHWLRTCEPQPSQFFVLGISMGGIVSTLLAAIEPDLDGVAVCLAGGDLATLVLHSAENRVRRWVEWRRLTDGVGSDHLTWELQQHVLLEPLRLAPSVETSKVLFISAEFDEVVPRHHQDLLWEALGRPARLQVPFGHYSAALAIDHILGAAGEHFRARSRSTD